MIFGRVPNASAICQAPILPDSEKSGTGLGSIAQLPCGQRRRQAAMASGIARTKITTAKTPKITERIRNGVVIDREGSSTVGLPAICVTLLFQMSAETVAPAFSAVVSGCAAAGDALTLKPLDRPLQHAPQSSSSRLPWARPYSPVMRLDQWTW